MLVYEGEIDSRGFHQVCVLDAEDEPGATELLKKHLIRLGVTLVAIEQDDSRSVSYEKLSDQLRSNCVLEDRVMAMSGRIWFESPT